MNETHLNHDCGCCEGVAQLTPLPTANRPGLDTLVYRVGTHSSFLETMIARLSSLALELPAEEQSDEKQTFYPLQDLTTRQTSDPAIAMLDGWATVADVLTFYQERIANEGYLRTATERHSILELARLIGYKLRPGVAASVYLAFTLDDGYQVTIPAGNRAQSIPGPGELPQFFETAEPLPARAAWNELKPRQERLSLITADTSQLYFEGISLNLKPNDPLLFVYGAGDGEQEIRRVESVEVQAAANRTLVNLQPISLVPEIVQTMQAILDRYRDLAAFGIDPEREMAGRVLGMLDDLQQTITTPHTAASLTTSLATVLPDLREEEAIALEGAYSRLSPWVGGLVAELTAVERQLTVGLLAEATMPVAALSAVAGRDGKKPPALLALNGLLTALKKPASIPPANNLRLPRDPAAIYAANADMGAKLLTTLQPALRPHLYNAWQNQSLTLPQPVAIYALRTHAAIFGHNAPAVEETFDLQAALVASDDDDGDWRLNTEVGLPGGGGSDERVIREGEEFKLTLPDDTITITIITLDTDGRFLGAFEFNFQFEKRFLTVNMKLERGQTPEIQVFSSGGKHTVTVTDNRVQSDIPFVQIGVAGQIKRDATALTETEVTTEVWLDTAYEKIVPDSWVALERPYPAGDQIPQTVITRIVQVSEGSRADYGLSGIKSTHLTLDEPWLDPVTDTFEVIRRTAVYTQMESINLLPAPLDPVVEAICGDEIELDGLYDGLEAGRWLIISGERTDVKPEMQEPANARDGDADTAVHLPGIPATELVMLAGVTQDYNPAVPGETIHTRLQLANNLAYCYKRDTVTIYGNVAKATHGETRQEVLGSGDGSKPFQRFTLKQPPVTFVSAATPSGVASSLVVRVNDIKWHEAEHLVGLEPADRQFTTQTDDEEKMTVIFGDGRYGARLPTGSENVKAVYRNGIGQMGNVAAGQISLLVTRPLGVKGVINPLPATGGADRDDRDQARSNAPTAVTALDRLVSVSDYADFARTFAGIGKASAVRLADGRRQVVHLTIAGAGDIPIDKNSDLYRNLGQAVHRFGDPHQPVQIDIYRRKLLILSGKVRLLPDYLWEAVAPQIQAALRDTFSFDRRHLGQHVVLSEVISVIQAVRGVAYVDVDILDAIPEDASLEELTNLAETLSLRSRIVAHMARINPSATDPDEHIQPAELIYLSPDVPDTLILTELSHD
ncbi:MAG: putative baseplate assembly protein [Anaerolineae bacterium]|nr:putative baseplate assembly protein [Anaerolineae bacterium]